MPLEIVEVLKRSKQGFTEPFICRGDDDKLYFVKGRAAGRRSLLCEWIAGHLALALNLPIAPFTVAYVPEDILEYAEPLVRQDLGAGLVFASMKQAVEELEFPTIAQVPLKIRQDIFAFDWWIANADRTLTEKGGNPNLLWEPATASLVIIDHNQAFDRRFSKTEALSTHVFHQQGLQILKSPSLQEDYRDHFSKALNSWQTICETIPKVWWFVDEEMTVPSDFSRDLVHQQLLQHLSPDFWTMR